MTPTEVLAQDRAHLSALNDALADIRTRDARLVALEDTRLLTPQESDARHVYRAVLAALDGEGWAASMGVPHEVESLAHLSGTPGRAAILRRIAANEHRVAEAKAVLDRWPTADTTHPFRYTGPTGRAIVDGRRLKPGEVVQLSQAQATAWADRFEPVADVEEVAG